ncbi:cation-translocating P-type ATPase [Pseudomonas abietaniphila]|uniref:ATPase, P-type (Transporting), HAD superfamily, subfamily IC n=1 Tax=Pseudomonas abietaniphila TaxID=89065 RepID=A0A1G8GCS4_9PSED|nr:cation-translocating P-type ATPase [Pseudomonas abietaniphila]SDH92163.1 ATPase, P-type (transporting), HAD superfamily, subfamily IC [Pseudomonas abietaniphila]
MTRLKTDSIVVGRNESLTCAESGVADINADERSQSLPWNDASLIGIAELVCGLGTDLNRGLSSEEAFARLRADGPNELRAVLPVAAWRRALAQLHSPLIYLLVAAAAIALAAWWFEGQGHDGVAAWPLDAIVIVCVILLNASIGWLQDAKATQAVAALAKMTIATSTVLRDGALTRVSNTELVKGDLLVLAEGDAVGADARVAQSSALMVLEASLTGESEAVLKDAALLQGAVALGDRLNMVFKGTAVAQGTGRAIVTATGMQTEVGAIATLLECTQDAPTPLQIEIAYLGKVLGVSVLLISCVVVAIALLISETYSVASVMKVLLMGVSLAVAAVPEGLPAILSVVLAMGVRRMALRHAIVKQLASVETLGSASVIATDKTGTLTRGEMTLQRVMTASGRSDITGVGYAPDGRAERGGIPLTAGILRDELEAVLDAGSLAGNAQLRRDDAGVWAIQGDPTDAAFLVAQYKLKAGAGTTGIDRLERIGEIPFTSHRKMMSVLVADRSNDAAHLLFTKGAPDVLLAHCSHVRRGRATVPLDKTLRSQLVSDVETMAGDALRTLAVSYRKLSPGAQVPADRVQAAALEQNLEYIGAVGIIDPPRIEAAQAIAQASHAGIRVIMITGDHPRTALRVAVDLGIVAIDAPVLTGIEIDALEDADFAVAALTTSVFARVAPSHKLRIVRALQNAGNVVAMTGDGVNDAPALKAADIGVAMGVTGTEVTKEAARMILTDDNFATIVMAVREGRGVLDNICKFLRYLLSSNLAEVLTVFIGLVAAGIIGLKDAASASDSTVVLPLLATQILWINLVTDSGPALALGVDPIDEEVMARTPRARTQRIIDAGMLRSVIETGVVMALLTLATLDLFLPGGLIEPIDLLASQNPFSLEVARTAAFTVLVFTQLFNCFNARSETKSALRGAFSNRWLLVAVLVSLLLQIVVVNDTSLNLAFGTVPMSIAQWSTCVVIASGVLWFSEARKFVRRLHTSFTGLTPKP